MAFPLASGFIIWLAGALASIVAFRKAKKCFVNARYVLGSVLIAASVAFIWAAMSTTTDKDALAVERTPQPANAPIGIARGVNPGRVAWVWDANVTNWAGPMTGQYWYTNQCTDQDVVNKMMSRAIRGLASEATDAEAWDAIFRYFNEKRGNGNVGYTPGEKIAIKVNHTLSYSADPAVMDKKPEDLWHTPPLTDCIDNSPQLTIALLKQLIDVAGVNPADISIGDPSRIMPNYWYNMVHDYPGLENVVYLTRDGFPGCGRTFVKWSNVPFYWSDPDPSHWPADPNQDYLPTHFAQAAYFINFPILKSHQSGGITICGKNHYGSLIRNPNASDQPNPDDWYSMHNTLPDLTAGMGHYRALVDLLGHPQLGGKTLLFLVDGLFAGEGWDGVPSKWTIAPFNNDWPSSIFVSQDGIAMDSVGFDFLLAQWPKDPGANMSGSDDYLHEAALIPDPCSGTNYDPNNDGGLTESLGVHEHWNNATDRQYSRNLNPVTGTGIELVTKSVSFGDIDKDGGVEFDDFVLLAAAWESSEGGAGWNADCDISEPSDGVIDIGDLSVLCENWLSGFTGPLVEPGAELIEEYSAEGIYFEGPSWDPVTEKLYFSKRTDGYQILRLDSPGVATVWMNNTPATNGTFLSINGRLLTADEDTQQIRSHRIGASGPEDSIVLGTGPKKPNDLCQLPNGDIYFTGPDWGSGPTNQGVYLLEPNGVVTLVKNGLYQPNGIVSSNDGTKLYVAESSSSDITKKRWWVFPINPDGRLGTGSVFFKPASPPATNDPDGMTIDEYGNLYFAGLGGVWIVSSKGQQLEMITVPEFASNLEFGDPDGYTLFITCQDKVYSLAMRVRGAIWIDRTAPSPNPMQWSAPPEATGPYSIGMTATTAGDAFGAEYYFENQTASGHDSGWQNTPYYEDAGLERDIVYSYRVKARDKSYAQNETVYSSPASSTTEVNAPPIEFDSCSSAAGASPGSTLSWSHTIGSGQNRILVVGTQSQNPSGTKGNLSIKSIKFNGANLNKVGQKLIETGGYALTVEMWYMLESRLPAAGTYTVQVTYVGSVDTRTAGAISIANALQAAPEDVKNSSAVSSPISTTVTCSPKAMVIDAVACGNVSTFTALTGGMTERYDLSAISSAGAGSTTPTDVLGPVTVQWSNSNANRLAQIAASFAPLP